MRAQKEEEYAKLHGRPSAELSRNKIAMKMPAALPAESGRKKKCLFVGEGLGQHGVDKNKSTGKQCGY
jgi:hypothetical protein